MAETCSTCRWWNAPKPPPAGWGGHVNEYGICRHFANDRFSHQTGFAGPVRCADQTRAEHSCREWTAREGAKVEPVKPGDDVVIGGASHRVISVAPVVAPTPPSEGWIPWAGGECPVAAWTAGAVLLRDKSTVSLDNMAIRNWRHDEFGPTYDDFHIIAYRVHKPADFRLEAGKYYITAAGERVGPMRVYGQTGEVPSRLAFCVRHNGCWTEEGDAWGDEKHDIVALAADQESKP